MNAADTIYGNESATPSTSTAVPDARQASADVLYGATKVNVVRNDPGRASMAEKMFNNTVSSPANAIAKLLELEGVEAADATQAARSIDGEIGRIGANVGQQELLDALSKPVTTSRAEVNELRKQSLDRLAEMHGGRAGAEKILRETDRWLKRVAPGVQAALGRSAAGLDTGVLVALTNAYIKRGRS